MQSKKVGILEILNSKWFIQPEAANAFLPLVVQMVQNPMAFKDDSESGPKDDVHDYSAFQSNLYGISSHGLETPPEKAPKNSIAVIQFSGAITKSDQWCADSGTQTKADLLNRCFANSNISGIVMHITSPGGAGNAIEALRGAMTNKNKPIVSYIDEMAASAGYWIASMADEIVMLNNRTQVGSIGAYVTLANWDGYYEKLGLKVQRIYSSFSEEKNKAVEEALKGNTDLLVADLDKFTSFFFDDVKAARPQLENPNDKKIFKGAMYYGDQAVANGLADHLGDWATVVERIEALKPKYKGGFYV